jgi:nicotinate-nucleotide adenylyltransferase|tara:strand:+ start:3585 stop:4127 length:543 start_codon:yes stop_codon:yes gene_type:complete
MKFMDQDKLENKKIGLLGGSFDPAHLGHIKISKVAKKKYNLKHVIWAITKQNPFKKKNSNDLKKRIAYSKKINKKNKFIKIECFEDKIKSNRTIDLIKYLKKKFENTEIYFIMGADNLLNFHKWKGCNSITKLCKILVFDRKGYKSKALRSKAYIKYNKNAVEFIKFNKVNISSSQLRKI